LTVTLLGSMVASVDALAAMPAPDLKITEWMYDGANGEFIEVTNLGVSSIDMNGWSFDDDSRVPGTLDLSAFGLINPGESVILAEAVATDFRTAWGLAGTIKVIGGNTTNLGRGDEINLYDAAGLLVYRLTYADNGAAGGPRTKGASGHVTALIDLGTNNAPSWRLSSAGDMEHSWVSGGGDIGSPGITSFVSSIPEVQTYVMLLAGLGLVSIAAHRKMNSNRLVG